MAPRALLKVALDRHQVIVYSKYFAYKVVDLVVDVRKAIALCKEVQRSQPGESCFPYQMIPQPLHFFRGMNGYWSGGVTTDVGTHQRARALKHGPEMKHGHEARADVCHCDHTGVTIARRFF